MWTQKKIRFHQISEGIFSIEKAKKRKKSRFQLVFLPVFISARVRERLSNISQISMDTPLSLYQNRY